MLVCITDIDKNVESSCIDYVWDVLYDLKLYLLGFLTKESKPVGNGMIGNALEKKAVGGGLGNVLEKKTAVPGGLGNLLENKKGVLGGGLSVAVEKKAGFGQLLNKNLGNTAEKKGGGFPYFVL